MNLPEGVGGIHIGEGVKPLIDAASVTLKNYLRGCEEDGIKPGILDLALSLGQRLVHCNLVDEQDIASAIGVGYCLAIWEQDEAKKDPALR